MNLFVTQTCHVMGPLATLVLLRTISLLIAVKRSWNKPYRDNITVYAVIFEGRKIRSFRC